MGGDGWSGGGESAPFGRLDVSSGIRGADGSVGSLPDGPERLVALLLGLELPSGGDAGFGIDVGAVASDGAGLTVLSSEPSRWFGLVTPFAGPGAGWRLPVS